MGSGDWLDTWLKEYKRPGIKARTYDIYETVVRYHVKPTLESVALKDLRPEHLQHLYNDKHEFGLSSKTIRNIHGVVHEALEQAVKNQLVVRNVSEATVLPKSRKKEVQPLSLDQVKKLLTTIREDRLYRAILLEFNTGLRLGELLALRWQDVDLEAGILRVKQSLIQVKTHSPEGRKTQLIFQEPKSSHSRRTIPLPQDVLNELRHHKTWQARERLLLGPAYQDHGLVFCHPDGRPLNPRNFEKNFAQMLKKAGLPRIRFHDTRHTFATLMLELEESPKTVQTMLGHSNISTTLDLYSHVSIDLERRAVDKLSNALGK